MDIEALLRLSTVPGVGSNRLRALIARFKSPNEVFRASIVDLSAVVGIDKKTARNIKTHKDGGFAKKQLSKVNTSGAHIVTYWDARYPQLLKNIPDPPAMLFIKGSIIPEDKESIAVVGMRKPSEYGVLVTEKLCSELVAQNITVVSGLARGIDTKAHNTTIEAGGRTIAVLGSGIDVIYPYENRTLAEKISKRGVVISEYPMGSEPDAPNFPRRNRLISGMSLGTLVIEAGEKSGALITANIALEQNREVFAVPGNIFSSKSFGTNSLIQEGAKLVLSTQDIIDELRPQLTHLKKVAKQRRPVERLTDLERKLLDSLSEVPLHIDMIAHVNKLSTSQALTLLLTLELKDFVKQLAGKMFVRT